MFFDPCYCSWREIRRTNLLKHERPSLLRLRKGFLDIDWFAGFLHDFWTINSGMPVKERLFSAIWLSSHMKGGKNRSSWNMYIIYQGTNIFPLCQALLSRWFSFSRLVGYVSSLKGTYIYIHKSATNPTNPQLSVGIPHLDAGHWEAFVLKPWISCRKRWVFFHVKCLAFRFQVPQKKRGGSQLSFKWKWSS